MGASEADVRYAMELCLDVREGLSVESCGPRRFALEMPARRVRTEAYGIDRLEVSQGAYRRCVVAGRCAPPRVADSDPRLSASSLPVVGVDLADAEAYCRFVGGRLPTEEEWERAARGVEGRRRFPWGRLYNPRLANHGRPPLQLDSGDGHRYASPVEAFASGRSPYGLLNMAGNVWEWTGSPPSEEQLSFLTDPESYRVIRGGSFHHSPVYLRVTARNFLPRSEARGDVGMRCAYDPPRRSN
jgi:formylglycine-generating enzyme required for sulfatase activity